MSMLRIFLAPNDVKKIQNVCREKIMLLFTQEKCSHIRIILRSSFLHSSFYPEHDIMIHKRFLNLVCIYLIYRCRHRLTSQNIYLPQNAKIYQYHRIMLHNNNIFSQYFLIKIFKNKTHVKQISGNLGTRALHYIIITRRLRLGDKRHIYFHLATSPQALNNNKLAGYIKKCCDKIYIKCVKIDINENMLVARWQIIRW